MQEGRRHYLHWLCPRFLQFLYRAVHEDYTLKLNWHFKLSDLSVQIQNHVGSLHAQPTCRYVDILYSNVVLLVLVGVVGSAAGLLKVDGPVLNRYSQAAIYFKCRIYLLS